MNCVSLFSGSVGLDLGIEEAGLTPLVCIENDDDCVNTLRLNRPELPVIHQDIREVTTAEILATAGAERGKVFCVSGGPPCQSFSSGGKRGSILDPRGSLFMEFLRVVKEAQPAYFVFENVAQIVTAAIKHRPIEDRPGKNWNLSLYNRSDGHGTATPSDASRPLEQDELSGAAIKAVLEEFDALGYYLNFGVVNAADYGVPQRRLRFVMLGSRVTTAISLPEPSHSSDGSDGLPRWRTLRDALKGLEESDPLHSSYTDRFKRFFELVPPGGNWRSLPSDLQREALGKAFEAGGGKTGFFRRLEWDSPTPTIVAKPNRKSSAICHPDETRPLSVRECARLQGFPDSWEFTGSMHRQYSQIGNAVPLQLGRILGEAILAAEEARRKSKRRVTSKELGSWRGRKEEMLESSKQVLRDYSRNGKSRKKPAQSMQPVQEELFAVAGH